MASLLVHVPIERLCALLAPDLRNSGRAWQVGREQLPEPALDRLDENDTLFVFTIDGDRAIVVATIDEPWTTDGRFAGGDALVRDFDITDLLPRLGCADPSRALDWAMVPRVLPPGDVDLLRYTLDLASDVRPPAPPEPIVGDDAAQAALRAAVYADPDADELRAVYADYLQSRGDPRGELIALQLARAATDGPVSERERVLVERHRFDCAAPLADVLQSFTLARGFIATCITRDVIPNVRAIDPAWSTVTELATTDTTLLYNPHVRARRIHITGRELAMLVRSPRPLPYEAILGGIDRWSNPARHRAHTGVRVQAGWDELMAIGALTKLRVLSLNNVTDDQLLDLLRRPLGHQLDHLDLYVDDTYAPPVNIRPGFDRGDLPVLTIRFTLAPFGASTRTHRITGIREVDQSIRRRAIPGVLGFQRSSREPILRLQLARPPSSDQLVELMRFLAPLTRGIQRIELHDLENPEYVAQRFADTINRLETIFARVIVRPSESMAP